MRQIYLYIYLSDLYTVVAHLIRTTEDQDHIIAVSSFTIKAILFSSPTSLLCIQHISVGWINKECAYSHVSPLCVSLYFWRKYRNCLLYHCLVPCSMKQSPCHWHWRDFLSSYHAAPIQYIQSSNYDSNGAQNQVMMVVNQSTHVTNLILQSFFRYLLSELHSYKANYY